MSYETKIPNLNFHGRESEFLELVGQLIGTAAKKLAPVNKYGYGGTLRQSIDHRITDNYVEIGSYVEYAPYVEKGTGIYAEKGDGRKTPWVYYDEKSGKFFRTQGMKQQAFLKPAMDANIDKIIKIAKEVFAFED